MLERPLLTPLRLYTDTHCECRCAAPSSLVSQSADWWQPPPSADHLRSERPSRPAPVCTVRASRAHRSVLLSLRAHPAPFRLCSILSLRNHLIHSPSSCSSSPTFTTFTIDDSIVHSSSSVAQTAWIARGRDSGQRRAQARIAIGCWELMECFVDLMAMASLSKRWPSTSVWVSLGPRPWQQ
jgi:hypothetical protein